MRKKSQEDEQIFEELNSAHDRSQAKCQLVQTSYIKRIKLFLFLPELSRSLWKNLDRGRVCSLRSVCTYDLGQDSPIPTSCSVNKS